MSTSERPDSEPTNDSCYQHLRRKFTPPSEREPPEYRGFAAPGEHPGFPEQSPEWEGYEA